METENKPKEKTEYTMIRITGDLWKAINQDRERNETFEDVIWKWKNKEEKQNDRQNNE